MTDVFCSSWGIRRLALLKTLWCVLPGRVPDEGLECGCLSHATIVESLGHHYGLWRLWLKREGRLWGEAGAGYLPGNNNVKVWGDWSWFVLVNCYG